VTGRGRQQTGILKRITWKIYGKNTVGMDGEGI